MRSFYRPASTKHLLLVMALMAATANASLAECNKTHYINETLATQCKAAEQSPNTTPISTLKAAIPTVTPTTIVAGGGFPLNQTRSSDAIADSAPLLVLICSLLGIVLIRAKSYNGK